MDLAVKLNECLEDYIGSPITPDTLNVIARRVLYFMRYHLTPIEIREHPIYYIGIDSFDKNKIDITESLDSFRYSNYGCFMVDVMNNNIKKIGPR